MSEDRFARFIARMLGARFEDATDARPADPGEGIEGKRKDRLLPEVHADPAALTKHESIRVYREQGELRIEFDWLNATWRRGFRIGAAVVALGAVVGILLGWDVRAALPIGLLLVYLNVAFGFDRTVITIRDGRLRVVNRPLPWPLGGSVRLADIEEFRIRLTRRGTTGDWSGGQSDRDGDMFVRLRSGREKKLLSDQDAYRLGIERLKWVMQELRRELASGRWTRS